MLIVFLIAKIVFSIYIMYAFIKWHATNLYINILLFLISTGIIQQFYYIISSAYKRIIFKGGYIGFFINKIDLGLIMPLALVYLVDLYVGRFRKTGARYVSIPLFIGLCLGLSGLNIALGVVVFNQWPPIYTAISCSLIFYIVLLLAKYLHKEDRRMD